MILRGRVAWAKVLGKPAEGYTKGDENREWSIDFELDEAAEARYLKEGGSDFYVKEKENHPLGKHIPFKRRELKRDGTKAKPITVKAPNGADWDPSVKIGNGSVVDVKFALNEVVVGNAKRMKPSLIAIKVVDLVPYEGKGDAEFEDFQYDDGDWSEAGQEES